MYELMDIQGCWFGF